MNIGRFEKNIAEATRRYNFNPAQRERQLRAMSQIRRGERINPEELDRRSRINYRIATSGVLQDLTRAQPNLAADRESLTHLALERLIGKDDLQSVSFLHVGSRVSRAVGRVLIGHAGGGIQGSGTGFLVSPHLLMTNNHVFPDPATARFSSIQLNYYEIAPGQITRSVDFGLDPDHFFLTSERLDYTIVAVKQMNDENRSPSEFGAIPLLEQTGKAINGERVNIIQHPGGEPKQVALRQNKIVDVVDDFLQYEADTQRGSSGGAVLNDSWQLAALHHAGTPATDDNGNILLINGAVWDRTADTVHLIRWIANEGVRISSIVKNVRGRSTELTAEQQEMFEQAFATPASPTPPDESVMTPAPASSPGYQNSGNAVKSSSREPGTATWTLPVEITVKVPGASLGSSQQTRPAPRSSSAPEPAFSERNVEPIHDPDYTTRKGYDPDFLGVTVPLPDDFDENIAAKICETGIVIPYHHFSLVLHKERRLALFTAANVDADPQKTKPEAGKDYTRDGLGGLGENDREKWFLDPRVDRDFQLPDKFFDKDRTAFDKGHIVRRNDVVWGDTYQEVRFANGDTFHTTNCSPQVKGYNRSNLGEENWGDLENFILGQADSEKLNVWAGPILREDDPIFTGVDLDGTTLVKIPSSYWKVVIAEKDGALQTFAFVLDQDLSDVQFEFAMTDIWRENIVSVADLESRVSGFTFPQELHDSDMFTDQFADEVARRFSITKSKKRHEPATFRRGDIEVPMATTSKTESPSKRSKRKR